MSHGLVCGAILGLILCINKGLSYRTKANDADEVGLSWLGAILDKGLADISDSIPIVVIGHSFGARASSMAVCAGPVIYEQSGIIEKRKRVDKLISLQGAYTVHRFIGAGGDEKAYYPEQCGNANYIALTSSEHDSALDLSFWSDAVGNDESFGEVCNDEKITGQFLCKTVNSKGIVNNSFTQDVKTADLTDWSKDNILYIKADNLIKYNAYKSGGGAHSDIYRNETGRLLWDLITYQDE